jgi:Flp pilus assembly protein TadD
MRISLLLVAVSSTALLAGCARNSDQAFKDISPAAASNVEAPSAVAPLTQLAQEALARGDAAASIPLAERALESVPGDAEASLVLAQAHLMQGNPFKAEGLFRDVLASDKSSAAANTGLGLSLLAQNRSEDARTVLLTAANQNANAQTKSNIAFALTLAGAPNDAVKLLDPLALGKDSSPKVRQNLAFALVMANERARAFEVAGYDLDGVAAARQVASWTEVAHAPFKQRLTQMAGLTVVEAPAYAQAETPKPAAVETVSPVSAAEPEQPRLPAEVFAQVETPMPSTAHEPVDFAEAEKPTPPAATPVVLRAPKLSASKTTAVVSKASFPGGVSDDVAKKAATTVAVVNKLGNWVVQIGAITFKTDQTLRLTKIFQSRLGKKSAVRVVTVDAPNGKLHRVLLAESQSRSSALKTCSTLRTKGRACFARDEATLTQSIVAAAPVKATPVKVVKASVSKTVSSKGVAKPAKAKETAKVVRI